MATQSDDGDVLKTGYTPIIFALFSYISLTFFMKKRLTLSDDSINLRLKLIDRKNRHFGRKTSTVKNDKDNHNSNKVIPVDTDIENNDDNNKASESTKISESIKITESNGVNDDSKDNGDNTKGNVGGILECEKAAYNFKHKYGHIKHKFGPHHEQFGHDDDDVPELTFITMIKYKYYQVTIFLYLS